MALSAVKAGTKLASPRRRRHSRCWLWGRAPIRTHRRQLRRRAAGALHYYDDDSASSLALQSGRAGLTFGPNAATAYKAGKDGKTKQVGTLDGWPLKAEIAFRTKKGDGLAVAAQSGLDKLIQVGAYGKILDRWDSPRK